MTIVDGLASSLVAASLLAPLLTRALAGHVRPGLVMGLELWTAGALLRLTGDASWHAILTAATVLTLRVLVRGGHGSTHLAPRR